MINEYSSKKGILDILSYLKVSINLLYAINFQKSFQLSKTILVCKYNLIENLSTNSTYHLIFIKQNQIKC